MELFFLYCSLIEQYIVQIMNNKDNDKINQEEYFSILRKIKNNPETTQRELATELGFSLGKSYKNKLLLYFNSKRNNNQNKTNRQFYEKKNERI